MFKPILLAAVMLMPELPTVMVVTKSDNRNELHYGVAMDDNCTPKGNSPLQPYWLMLERGPHRTEPLSEREARLLGIAHQDVAGNQVRFIVNGMPERAFTARLAKNPNGFCTSAVDSTVAGQPAQIISVHAQLKLFGVDYVELTGRTAEGKLVQERVHP